MSPAGAPATLRVAIINQRDGGGATAAARELQSGLEASGHTVAWFPSESTDSKEQLLEALAGFQPDIVHLHCWYQSYPLELLGALAPRYGPDSL